MKRWWASLLAVALALSLVPGTALAQESTPVESVNAFNGVDNGWVTILFPENVSTLVQSSYSVTFDGVPQSIVGITRISGGSSVRSVALKLASLIPDGAVIVVAYSKPASPVSRLYYTGTSIEVPAFRWKVGTGPIPTVAEVYAALKSYFSGTVTLTEVEDVLSGDDQTYHEKLVEEAAAGRLHERLPAGEGTNWSGEGTEGWVQIGSPSRLPDSEDTCGGETAPELTGGDSGNFYWACSDENTSNGRWVPVRIPQPGVDYAWDRQLLRPGDPEYNEDCLYVRRDEDGNPVLDENGDRIPRRVSKYDPATGTFTYNDGNSWDPIAEQCTTRGNPGSGPVFRQ